MWISILVISIAGTFLHYLYEISNHNKYVALFAAVNESTWEHLKLAITPMLLWGLYDGFIYGMTPNYFLAKSISILITIVTIPLIFYSYTKITKKPILIIDISTFYLAIIIGQNVFYNIIKMPAFNYIYNYLGAILLFVIFGVYLTATILPIENFIFKDPISKKYGINGHI